MNADPVQAKAGMVQHALSSDVDDSVEKMSPAFSTGAIVVTAETGPMEITPTTPDEFAATAFKSV